MEYEPHIIEDSAEPAEVLTSKRVSDDPVRDYLDNISKVPLLSAEQEVELAKRIEAGQYAAHVLLSDENTSGASEQELQWLAEDGVSAKKHFIEANMRLVVSIARKYARHASNMELLDLVQEGNIGLNRAVEKFDYQKGYKFSTYSTWWVRQAITRAIAEKERTVRLPVHLHDTIMAMNKVVRELEREGLPTTTEMIAGGMGVDVERVRNLQEWSKRIVSLDVTVDDDGETTLGSLIDTAEDSTEDMVVHSEMREKINEAVNMLSERDQIIVRMRFGLEDGTTRTLKEIGDEIGLTPERVRQVAVASIRKLRCHHELKQYIVSHPAS